MKEIKGDITEVKSGVLIQQVNCMGAMGAGVAKHTDEEKLIANIKAVAETYPEREVYIPKLIGCGLAGGDWPTVYEGIKDIDNLTIVEFN